MAGVKVTIEFEGIDQVIHNLDDIGKKFETNIQDATAKLGADAQDVMREHTHVRKGKLREGDSLDVGHFEFTLFNDVFYAKFIERGHMTPRGWRLPGGGYRVAKRRSHVGPFPFLEPAVQFVEEEIVDRLGKALGD